MTCKDCVHFEVCANVYGEVEAETEIKNINGKSCYYFKDKSKYIELPCKVGDTLYVLNRANVPQEMILDKPDIRCHCVDDDNLCNALCGDKKHKICAYRLKNDHSDISKTVFLTKSEAEAKLKELLNDN